MNEETIKKIYEGEESLFNLPYAIFLLNFNSIIGSVERGFDGGMLRFKIGSPEFTKALSYNDNIFVFSGAKTFQQVRELSYFLFDEKGVKRPWLEFLAKGKEINATYNELWLRTEMETAYNMSLNARQWMSFKDNDLLMYNTQRDEKVRESHRVWDRLVFPKTHVFWNTHMPPNDWACRCFASVVKGFKQSPLKGVVPNNNKLFGVNPGKVGYIFNENKHPYFRVSERFEPFLKVNFGLIKPEKYL